MGAPQPRKIFLGGPGPRPGTGPWGSPFSAGAPASGDPSTLDPDALRVYDIQLHEVFDAVRGSNLDVLGVELCGALKNVIALAAGIIDGLSLGNNAKASLITRGIVEITRRFLRTPSFLVRYFDLGREDLAAV